MAATQRDRLRGTLDILVLRTLAWKPSHGYAIARWLAAESGDAVRVEEGSLYPALYRMEERGLIESEWQPTDVGRPAKVYKLTSAGRKHLRAETAEWLAFTHAVTRILVPQS
jgi:transcriptional regulator